MKSKSRTGNRITAVVLIGLILCGPLPGLGAEESVPSPSEDGAGIVEQPAVKDASPRTGTELSMWKTLGLDVLVPGGGHFYRGSLVWGITFAALKIGGGYAIWYYHHEWDYQRSLYRSAKRGNLVLDPDHELIFLLPDGSHRTVAQLERDYDSSAQAFTITIALNAVVWTASLLLNWQAVREANESASPLFDISFLPDPVSGEGRLRAAYTFHL